MTHFENRSPSAHGWRAHSSPGVITKKTRSREPRRWRARSRRRERKKASACSPADRRAGSSVMSTYGIPPFAFLIVNILPCAYRPRRTKSGYSRTQEEERAFPFPRRQGFGGSQAGRCYLRVHEAGSEGHPSLGREERPFGLKIIRRCSAVAAGQLVRNRQCLLATTSLLAGL